MALLGGPQGINLITKTKDFVRSLAYRNYDKVWNELLTLEDQSTISEIYYPILSLRSLDVGDLPSREIMFGLGLGFQMDSQGERVGFFEGLRSSLVAQKWHLLDPNDFMVFAEGDSAIVVNGSRDLTFILTFKQSALGEYEADLTTWFVFAMNLKPSVLFDIALGLYLIGREEEADWYFKSASKLTPSLVALKTLVIENPLIKGRVKPARLSELRTELKYAVEAEHRIRTRNVQTAGRDPQWVISNHFKCFDLSVDIHISDQDKELLHQMSDADLRKSIAEMILGMSKQELRREARKPHGPAELADMVLELQTDHGPITLCLPIKSGREIKKGSVPESVIYQIWRPFVILDNAMVVFVTDRPCSQNLRHMIRLSTSKLGWPIAVIEDLDLARWLKVNNRLGR